MLSRPVVIHDNGSGLSTIRIWGSGMYTSMLKAKTGVWSGDAVMEIAGSISMSEMFINGNSLAPYGIIYDANVTAAPGLFDRVLFALCPTSGFVCGLAGTGFGGQHTMRDCFFNTCGGHAIQWVNGGQGNMLENTIVLGGTTSGLYMTSPAGSSGANHNEGQIVRSCAFLTNNNDPPLAVPCPGVIIDNGLMNVFTDNIIEGGIGSGAFASPHRTSVFKRNITSVGPLHFTNNWFGSGVRFAGAALEVGLLDNSFPGGGACVFTTGALGESANHTIMGNKFTGNGDLIVPATPSTYRLVLGNQRNVMVAYNTITGANNGVLESGSDLQIWITFNFFSQTASTFGAGTTWGLNSP
jgi:hypothetical protein